MSKILIVDDTQTILRSLSLILSKDGFEIITATSGEEAIKQTLANSPDLIMMDIQMDGGMDGFEACRLLKSDPSSKDIPILFLSAFEDTETKLKGFEAGGVDFIPKSFSKIEILTRVKIHLQIGNLQRALRKKNSYTTAILNAQKDLVLIYDADYKIENANASFRQMVGVSEISSDFSLVGSLRRYGDFEIPSSDKELIKAVRPELPTKVLIRGSDEEDTVYSLSVSRNVVLGELKFIVVLGDITIYEKARVQELELLKYKERYHLNQQKNAFKKQLKIIKDRLSHRYGNGLLMDAFYKPLDLLSGDAYGTIDIGEGKFLFYIIDAMGKGLSASVTSIQSTSFINNAVETAIEKDDFTFTAVLASYTHFIKKQLLDDELLCAVFVLIDAKNSSIQVANYGMPPLLMIKSDGSLYTQKPNNPPIMSFLHTYNIDHADFSDIDKLLVYSDGLNENEMTNGNCYQSIINEDFTQSHFLKDFLHRLNDKVENYDDDLTLIFLRKVDIAPQFERHSLPSTMQGVQDGVELLERYMQSAIFDKDPIDDKCISEVMLAATELLMNAHEHGNLGITAEEKQILMEEGEYEDAIMKLEKQSKYAQKSIELSFCICDDRPGRWLRVQIGDKGEGFDFNAVLKSMMFENPLNFQGRGIVMARDLCDGVYYNEKGNGVTLIKLL